MKHQLISMGALALAVIAGSATVFAAEDAKMATHDGKVVSATGSTLVMTDMDGKEHSHSLTTDTKVTCDGKVCKAADLKAGWKIRVTTKKSDEGAATCIEAIDKDRDFV